jgi:pilus assembly protein CpaB
MGNLKSVIPIVVSLVIAVAGTWFIYQWVQGQRAPKEVVQVQAEAVPVVVAAADIPWGTKLTPEMLKTLPFLKESLPAGHFSKFDDLKERVSILPLKVNDPITEHRLAPISVQTGGIASVLPLGKRAVAVKGDKVIGLAGLVNPGNRVDVLVTVEDSKNNIKESKTKLVLENIPVLATGTQIQKNEKGEPSPVDVYTLEVTPEESEKLSLAAMEGKIQLALRPITDTESVYTDGINIPKLLTSLSKPRPEPPKNTPVEAKVETNPAPVKKWTPRPSESVEVIKGTEVSRKIFTP